MHVSPFDFSTLAQLNLLNIFLKTYFILFQIKKPIIERRRRERINESLTELKTLLLEAMERDVSILNQI